MSGGTFRGPGSILTPGVSITRPILIDPTSTPPLDIPGILKRRERRKAEDAIERAYIKRGGPSSIGVLGYPLEEIHDHGNKTYSRRYEFGTLRTNVGTNDMPIVVQEVQYVADIDVAAIRCFGTEDPGGLFKPAADEPYLIITAVSPAGAFLEGQHGNIVQTWRSQRFDDIRAGEVFGTDIPAFRAIPFGPHGISLKLLLMEHEHGSEEDLRRRIKEKGDEISREIIDAAALLAGLDLDEQIADQVLDSNILSTLGDISVDALTALLQDDKVDEKTWWIPGHLLTTWADNGLLYQQSHVIYPNGEIPPHIRTNFPNEGIFDRTLLFSGGGGSYKVYLRVTPKMIITRQGPM